MTRLLSASICSEQNNIFLLQACKNALTKMEEGREVVYFHAVRKFETFYDKIGSNIRWKSPPTSNLLTVTET